MNAIYVSKYNKSLAKKVFNFTLASIMILFAFPFFVLFWLILKLAKYGPVFFTQKRVGLNGKTFTMLKFRTMFIGSENRLDELKNLNEADGPVFKIRNDPRYTKLGKVLARTGLDELPQVVNVLKGEMSLVGPRPLPLYEASKLKKDEKVRELVLQGITSPWVIKGAHNLSFNKWLELDKKYITEGTFLTDLNILLNTFLLTIKSLSSIGKL